MTKRTRARTDTVAGEENFNVLYTCNGLGLYNLYSAHDPVLVSVLVVGSFQNWLVAFCAFLFFFLRDYLFIFGSFHFPFYFFFQ